MDPTAVGAAPQVAYDGPAYRHLAPRHDPLSGEGAGMQGGRFNPPDSFPVLCLCLSRECAVAELRRAGSRLTIGLDGMLPRKLVVYRVALSHVLDLTESSVLSTLQVEAESLVGDDLSLTREIGVTGYHLGLQALRCASATGVGNVLVVFPQHIGDGTLEARVAEEWRTPADL